MVKTLDKFELVRFPQPTLSIMKTKFYLVLLFPVILFSNFSSSELPQEINTAVFVQGCEPEMDGYRHQVVKNMPQFPGCDHIVDPNLNRQCASDMLYAFVNDNLIYPKDAYEQGVEGKVVVRFIVEKEGCLSTIHVVSDIEEACGMGAEIVRLVNLMNDQGVKWIPGTHREGGDAQRVFYNLPFTFKIKPDTKVATESVICENGCLIGIGDSKEVISNFEMGPNPTQGNVHLKFDACRIIDGRLKIYNVLGQLEYDNALKIYAGCNALRYDFSHLKSGHKFLLVYDENGKVLKKEKVELF